MPVRGDRLWQVAVEGQIQVEETQEEGTDGISVREDGCFGRSKYFCISIDCKEILFIHINYFPSNNHSK